MTKRLLTAPSLSSASHDVPAGLVVFLVALPLCLGIALASGAPLFAGVIAGVIGGVIITLFSGSELSVSGPAAGLASIVAGAILSLGSFQAFLTAVVLAGFLQLAVAAIRAGSLGNFIPHSVIKGMLAAIGITIVLKQIPHAVGYDKGFTDSEVILGGYLWLDIFLDPIRAFSLEVLQPGALIITLVSVAALVLWEMPFMKRQAWTRWVPGALICVVGGALMNEIFAATAPSLALTAANDHLVELPVAASVGDFLGQFTFPDVRAVLRPDVWGTAVTIAAVASIESVLSIEAIDKMDPERRISDVNRELIGQGMGNMVSGLIGGLPITSVIVRSSANVYAGGRTRTSSFIHGMLLMICVATIPTFLNMVPLASLAAILLMVGYKLSSIKLIRGVWKEGPTQFLPFIVTCVGVVSTDILVGVGVGLLVSVFYVMRSYHRSAITLVNEGDDWLLRFNKDASFVNKAKLKDVLRSIPDGAAVIVDGTKALYIDHDIYETIHDFDASAPHRGVSVEYHNFAGKAGM
ncbi:MAG: SulP family inorganic anion transporter [Deltaproteobacteria bacterium]|nr:SulP family inorganic anion transporter [Deltaproteobacteria bacterium]